MGSLLTILMFEAIRIRAAVFFFECDLEEVVGVGGGTGPISERSLEITCGTFVTVWAPLARF
jgi:hypothetical protein